IIEASEIQLRPILVTGLTTVAATIPLILSSGAGAEVRGVIGIVIICGILTATFFTLFVVPVAYDLLARRTGTPRTIERRLERELARDLEPSQTSPRMDAA